MYCEEVSNDTLIELAKKYKQRSEESELKNKTKCKQLVKENELLLENKQLKDQLSKIRAERTYQNDQLPTYSDIKENIYPSAPPKQSLCV